MLYQHFYLNKKISKKALNFQVRIFILSCYQINPHTTLAIGYIPLFIYYCRDNDYIKLQVAGDQCIQRLNIGAIKFYYGSILI